MIRSKIYYGNLNVKTTVVIMVLFYCDNSLNVRNFIFLLYWDSIYVLISVGLLAKSIMRKDIDVSIFVIENFVVIVSHFVNFMV